MPRAPLGIVADTLTVGAGDARGAVVLDALTTSLRPGHVMLGAEAVAPAPIVDETASERIKSTLEASILMSVASAP